MSLGPFEEHVRTAERWLKLSNDASQELAAFDYLYSSVKHILATPREGVAEKILIAVRRRTNVYLKRLHILAEQPDISELIKRKPSQYELMAPAPLQSAVVSHEEHNSIITSDGKYRYIDPEDFDALEPAATDVEDGTYSILTTFQHSSRPSLSSKSPPTKVVPCQQPDDQDDGNYAILSSFQSLSLKGSPNKSLEAESNYDLLSPSHSGSQTSLNALRQDINENQYDLNPASCQTVDAELYDSNSQPIYEELDHSIQTRNDTYMPVTIQTSVNNDKYLNIDSSSAQANDKYLTIESTDAEDSQNATKKERKSGRFGKMKSKLSNTFKKKKSNGQSD